MKAEKDVIPDSYTDPEEVLRLIAGDIELGGENYSKSTINLIQLRITKYFLDKKVRHGHSKV